MNWTFGEIVRFLKKHGFMYSYARGSHHFYIGFQEGLSRQVMVPFHGNNKTLKPRTMRSIILQSGISKEDWFD